MDYVTIQDCKERLFKIAISFNLSEKTPDYNSNRKGLNELEGILQQVRNSWYDTRVKKAAFLMVAINKGHMFENGNKRLSLVIALDFLYRNGFVGHKPITRKAYQNWFERNFPDYKPSKIRFHTVYGWAFYNLNRAVAASSGRKFDSLKSKVEAFIIFSMK